ncbi:MAG: hypothetical protein ACK4U0_19160 [Mesorhizobium sp.]
MSFISDRCLDAALQVIIDEADRLCVCSAEPTTYTEATDTLVLGYKNDPVFGAIGDRTGGGRKTTVAAITTGAVVDTGDATHWAMVDTVNSRLLVVGALSSTVALTSGNLLGVAAFDVGMPDA